MVDILELSNANFPLRLTAKKALIFAIRFDLFLPFSLLFKIPSV